MEIDFIRDYEVEKLKAADYNPRLLTDDKLEKLKESLNKFGIIKPLIINGDNGILTAGHQRTKAIKAVGIKTAPVIRINGISKQDEIKFNLFHNSIETNKSIIKLNVAGCKLNDYSIIDAKDINIINRDNATVVNAICQLILRYGGWGSVVCDEDGAVFINNDYATACKSTNTPLLVYVVSNDKVREIMEYMSIDYGEYYYKTLGIKSYNQLYCQLSRLTGTDRLNKSSLYEKYVIPQINKDLRVLDFGAGKCGYVNLLKKQGYNIRAYEPNFQNRNNNIDIRMVVKMIKDIEKDVEQNGLYDAVVLDSVYNSVVDNEVEKYVTVTCMAFLKKTGVFFTGTRNLQFQKNLENLSYSKSKRRQIEFLDKNNFSATFRNGVWTMQHFHSTDTLKDLLSDYYENVEIYGKNDSQIWAIAKKPKMTDLELIETSLEFELNMEYPNNYKHNQHEKLLKLIIEEQKKQWKY